MRLNRPPQQETARLHDDIVFASSISGPVGSRMLPTPRAFGRSAFHPEYLWRVIKSI
jgi:hypothetical protein